MWVLQVVPITFGFSEIRTILTNKITLYFDFFFLCVSGEYQTQAY